jgi:hypothetical protein
METYIQFYKIEDGVLFLKNGFSSVWNVIKNKGKMLWIDPTNKFYPSVEGTVYISCGFDTEFKYVETLIKENKNVKFIVGGPAVNYLDFHVDSENFTSDKRNMFEILGIKPSEKTWNLVLPNLRDIDKLEIYYNYSLSYGNKCYWGKCKFCNRDYGIDADVDADQIPIIKPNRNTIWLNKLSVTPRDILTLFQNLKKESYYTFFIRGDREILKALNEKGIPHDRFRPIIGIEFPSNRMYDIMNKGIDVDSAIEVMKYFIERKCHVKITVIHGWNNLIKDDVKSIEYFLSKLEKYKDKISCLNHWLFAHSKEDETIPHTSKYGKTYYIYRLSDKQRQLNDEVLKMYKSFFKLYYNCGIFEEFFYENNYDKFLEKGICNV